MSYDIETEKQIQLGEFQARFEASQFPIHIAPAIALKAPRFKDKRCKVTYVFTDYKNVNYQYVLTMSWFDREAGDAHMRKHIETQPVNKIIKATITNIVIA